MNTEALFLFLILLLGLILCSFLGGNCGKEGLTGNFTGNFTLTGNGTQSYSGASTGSGSQYDNYNHYTGTSTQLSSGSTFYGQNGTTAVVVTNSNGTQSLQVTLPGSTTPVTFTPQQSSTDASSNSTDASSNSTTTTESYTNYYGNNGSITTYYGPNGATANVVYTNDGQQAIQVTTSSGTYIYNTSGSQNQQTSYSTSYQGAYGGSAGSVTGPEGNTAYYAQGPYGYTAVGTTSNNYDYYSNQYYGPYGGSAGSVTGPQGNTAYYAQGPAGNTAVGTTSDDWYASLPDGIPGNLIPPGQEDLYILKSQVVPPVCPACPTSAACPRQEPCPACPPCARCPEPAFECKKVPNYSAINNEYLPSPILNDFSTFGT